NWHKWLMIMLQILMIISFLMINLPVSYLKNGTSFQGVINHPNVFGIIAVLFIALLFANAQMNKQINKINLLIMPIISIYMVIISKSRTAFISFIFITFLYFIFINKKRILKIIVGCFSTAILTLLLFSKRFSSFLIDFIYKEQGQGDLLYSREGQINSLLENFSSNPLFGTGFAVPVLPYKSYEFSFNFIVEPGNIILAVLSYGGVIGFIIFFIYIIKIIQLNKHMFNKLIYLPISAILIS